MFLVVGVLMIVVSQISFSASSQFSIYYHDKCYEICLHTNKFAILVLAIPDQRKAFDAAKQTADKAWATILPAVESARIARQRACESGSFGDVKGAESFFKDISAAEETIQDAKKDIEKTVQSASRLWNVLEVYRKVGPWLNSLINEAEVIRQQWETERKKQNIFNYDSIVNKADEWLSYAKKVLAESPPDRAMENHLPQMNLYLEGIPGWTKVVKGYYKEAQKCAEKASEATLKKSQPTLKTFTGTWEVKLSHRKYAKHDYLTKVVLVQEGSHLTGTFGITKIKGKISANNTLDLKILGDDPALDIYMTFIATLSEGGNLFKGLYRSFSPAAFEYERIGWDCVGERIK